MEIVLTSIVAFASTNIDDIFVLMLFFGDKRYADRHIVIGQYLGVGLLILISFVGSFLGLLVDQKYIGLLGLLPMFFGVRALIKHFREKKEEELEQVSMTSRKSSVFTVTAVTFANGGDNIGIYIPLFASHSMSGKLTMIFIFLIMIAVWCWIGKTLTRHPAVARIIGKYGHVVTPIVLILLGVFILYQSGSFALIGGR